MPKRMLIDASHPEETRVIVLDGQKVEEFDFEAASKRPLKGNIYLAKVTRVEPSLQAAFVEYGGNRQGFLAFSEIHPDYYQIPVADRMALLAEQEAEARRRAEDEFESVDITVAPAPATSVAEAARADEGHEGYENTDGEFEAKDAPFSEPSGAESEARGDFIAEHGTPENREISENGHADAARNGNGNAEYEEAAGEEHAGAAEHGGGPDQTQSAQAKPLQSAKPPQRWTRRRHYKIQEVIKRRQIILVQVVKEERGTKGAALTTYLSLAGRYCVLMPNTPRGGGISRKITSATDRKRLKAAAQALELPEGMGLIIRTAGENRTKTEIKRDYEYLLRMWDTVRELTLRSNAPACVYEEGDLIKRAIRDLYNKDVTEIVVEGEDGYRNAKDFMRMLMPSHAKNVKPYKDVVPLFQRHHVEAQLDAMFSSTVTLRSGGYLVINQTEALVAIDVNSGRATREHSIEDTAYKTNLEAAEEIARQLRLRDLAGLIVIDFIDMEDGRNDRNVEKRLRDCVKNDRARVQIGKISQFGLLEMSRQRLRAGVVAGSTVTCPHCGGQGIVRSVESTALRVLRSVEEEGQRQRTAAILVRTQADVAMYTLNQKRRELSRIETEYGLSIQFEPKEGIVAGTFEIDRVAQKAPDDRPKPVQPVPAPVAALPEPQEEEPADLVEEEDEEEVETEAPVAQAEAGQDQQRPSSGRRKRRRRRRGRDHTQGGAVTNEPVAASAPASASNPQGASETPNGDSESIQNSTLNQSAAPGAPSPQYAASDGTRRKRRRRRRGRHGSRDGAPNVNGSLQSHDEGSADVDNSEIAAPHDPAQITHTGEDFARVVPNAPSEPVWSLATEHEHVQPSRSFENTDHAPAREEPRTDAYHHEREPESSVRETVDEPLPPPPPAPAEARAPEPAGPARKGWWQRPFRSRD